MEKSQLPQRQFHERSENNKLTDEVQFCKQQIAPVASGICDAIRVLIWLCVYRYYEVVMGNARIASAGFQILRRTFATCCIEN